MSAPDTPVSSIACRRPASKRQRRTGTLLRLKDQGYGFIRPDGGGPDFYVSITSMRDRSDWVEGGRVEFTPGDARPTPPGGKSKAAPAWDVVGLPASRPAQSQRPHEARI